jgi:hypothetical protein
MTSSSKSMSHSQQPSLEAGSGSSATARNTSNSGQREDPEDPMNAVYKAIVDNPDFINRLADHLRSNPGGLRGPRGPAGAAGTPRAVEGGNGHWRTDEVGFFFSDLHSSYGSSDIVTIGKDSFYRNATVFLDRLDDIVKLRGGELVRSNIPSCLHGAALQWYTTEVSGIEKASLRSPSTQVNLQDPLHRWKIAIRRRWDPPVSVALQNFMTTRYTFPMALAGVSMMQYFATKIRLAKEAGFADTHKQLLAVWNGLDVEIREHIPEPDEDMSLERFRKGLEERERLWKEKLLRNRVRSPVNGQRFAGNVSYGRDFPPRSTDRSNERPWAPPGQNRGGPPRGNQPWRARNDPPARIGIPQQRLQLTAGPNSSQTPKPQVKAEPSISSWTSGRRGCAKCGG